MTAPAKHRPDVEVFAEIAAIDQLARTRIERALPEGLSAAGLAVLNHFSRSGASASPAELAGVFRLTKGAITNTLGRLEALGLVTVAKDESDGRRKLIALTPAGVQTQRAAQAALRPLMEALRRDFSQNEFETALPFLRRLGAWLAENR